MTELDPRRDEDNSWPEAAFGEGDVFPEEPEPEEPPRSRLRFIAAWLAVAGVLIVCSLIALAAGQRYYNPAARIPVPPGEGLQAGLFGISRPLLSDVQSAQRLVPEGQSLSLEGTVERLPFPRTVADRLFGKRKEDALVFTARPSSGEPLRVLALRDRGEAVLFALEVPVGRGNNQGIEGLFVGVAPGPTRDAIAALMPAVDAASRREHDATEFTIFGPFDRGEEAALRARIARNPVLRHLAGAVQGDAGVSVAAPAFVILATPGDRTINAIYQPASNLVMQPLWGENTIASFAHELVHAYFDEVAPNETAAQREAQIYLEANQGHLYGDIVGDLYERLDRLGQAEEALAFLVGAFAARQPATVAPVRVLENPNLLSRSAGLLRSDAEFLIGLGLLPPCMDPTALGYEGDRISFAYYDLVDKACQP